MLYSLTGSTEPTVYPDIKWSLGFEEQSVFSLNAIGTNVWLPIFRSSRANTVHRSLLRLPELYTHKNAISFNKLFESISRIKTQTKSGTTPPCSFEFGSNKSKGEIRYVTNLIAIRSWWATDSEHHRNKPKLSHVSADHRQLMKLPATCTNDHTERLQRAMVEFDQGKNVRE